VHRELSVCIIVSRYATRYSLLASIGFVKPIETDASRSASVSKRAVIV